MNKKTVESTKLDRDIAILLMEDDLSGKQISEILNISYKSYESRRARLYKKLGITSRWQLNQELISTLVYF